MPRIPIITGSNPLPKLPGPTLDRERRPTVDNREVSAAVGALGKSTEQPMLPDSLAAPWKALGAVGAAISEAGSVVSAIAITDQRNQDKITVSKADTIMALSGQESENYRAQNPDPDKWLEGHDTIAKKAKEEIDALPMSATAKAEVAARWERFNGMSGKQVAGAAIGERARMARQVNSEGVTLGIQTQDMERVLAENADAEKNLRWSPQQSKLNLERFKEEGERQKNQQEAETIKAAENEAILMARAGGEKAGLARVEQMPLDERGKERARGVVRQAAAAASGQIMDDVVDSMLNGDITSEAGLKAAVGEDNPFFGPVHFKQASKYLDTLSDETRKDNIEKNGYTNAVELMHRANAYDPKSDPTGEQYLAMKFEIAARVPAGQTEDIEGILRSKRSNTPAPIPEASRGYMNDTLKVVYDPLAGPFKWKEKKLVSGRMEEVETSAEIRERAFESEGKTRKIMAEWAAQNPEDAKDIEKVKKKLIEAIPEGTRGATLKAMKGDLGAADVRQFVPAPELPNKLPAPLRPYADDFIEAAQTYGLNPKFLAAISMLETGGGTSKAFREKRNAMGISDAKGPTEQESVRAGIFHMAQRLASKKGPYGRATTIEEIGAVYSPPGAANDYHGTNSGWASNVRAQMRTL